MNLRMNLMPTYENNSVSRETIRHYPEFNRLPGRGLTEERFSRTAVDQEACLGSIERIIGFLSTISHDLSRALDGLNLWQPKEVLSAADAIYTECLDVGALHASRLALELRQVTAANHPRESRKTYQLLRTELIFVWQDLQSRLEVIRLNMKNNEENLKLAN